MTVAEMHIAVKMGLDKSEALSLPAFQTEEIDFWLNEAVERFIKTRYSGNNTPFAKGFEQSQKRVDDLRTLILETRISPIAASAIYDKPNSFIVESADFPSNYFLFLNDEVSITFTHSGTGTSVTLRTGVTECTSDSYLTKVSDPYGEHILHMNTARPLRLFSEKGVELITDGNYAVPYYYMRYIRKPNVINLITTTTVPSGSIAVGKTYLVVGNNIVYNSITYTPGNTFIGITGVTTFTGTGTINLLASNCDLPEHTHREIVDMTVNKLLENIESPRYQTHTNELNKIE